MCATQLPITKGPSKKQKPSGKNTSLKGKPKKRRQRHVKRGNPLCRLDLIIVVTAAALQRSIFADWLTRWPFVTVRKRLPKVWQQQRQQQLVSPSTSPILVTNASNYAKMFVNSWPFLRCGPVESSFKFKCCWLEQTFHRLFYGL